MFQSCPDSAKKLRVTSTNGNSESLLFDFAMNPSPIPASNMAVVRYVSPQSMKFLPRQYFHVTYSIFETKYLFCLSLLWIFLFTFHGEFMHITFYILYVQGASGIDARFLKLSPASAVSPIMTKFSQYNPHSTFAGKIKGPATGDSESSHCQKNPRRMREDISRDILRGPRLFWPLNCPLLRSGQFKGSKKSWPPQNVYFGGFFAKLEFSRDFLYILN
jgi:hypothetical protein